MSSITHGDPKLHALASHINESLSAIHLPSLPEMHTDLDKHNHGHSKDSIQYTTQIPANSASVFIPSIGNTMSVASFSNAPPNYTNGSNQMVGNYPMRASSGIATNQNAASPPLTMDKYFKQESENIINQHNSQNVLVRDCSDQSQSRKKTILTGVYSGIAVFVMSFVILVAARPSFVMKENKKKNGIVERKCNFLVVFIISLFCGVVVLITAGVVAAKIKTNTV